MRVLGTPRRGVGGACPPIDGGQTTGPRFAPVDPKIHTSTAPAARLSQKRSFTALINLHADLLRSGYYADDETVRLIMRELGLEPCQPKPFRPITTIAGDGCSPAAGAGRRCARPTSGSAKDGRSGLLHLGAIHVDMALRWQVRRGHVPVELERRAKPGIDQGVEQGVDLLWGLVRCGVEPTGDDG